MSFRCPTCGDKQPNPLCRECGADMDPIQKHAMLYDIPVDWSKIRQPSGEEAREAEALAQEWAKAMRDLGGGNA